jgi:hypothetical protein
MIDFDWWSVGAKANRRTGTVCLKLPRVQLLLLLKLFPVDEEKIAQSALKSFDAHAASRLSWTMTNIQNSLKLGLDRT